MPSLRRHGFSVKLELEGARAHRGIELDSLERFIENLRTALRDFERSATAREYQIRRGGHPDARAIAATNFRLVGYRTGSAVLELQEAPPNAADDTLTIPTVGAATQNIANLLDSLEQGDLDPAVIDDLDETRRAIGEDGWFRITVTGRRKRGLVNEATITRLRKKHTAQQVPTHVTVFGRLHLIATEGPRVEIRGTDNYNWSCTYPPELEPKILGLIKRQVRAEGLGVRDRANRGTLQIEQIEQLPQYEQTPLFSGAAVPVDELEREQGITKPQGLSALSIADLPDGDEIDRYLAAILDEGRGSD